VNFLRAIFAHLSAPKYVISAKLSSIYAWLPSKHNQHVMELSDMKTDKGSI